MDTVVPACCYEASPQAEHRHLPSMQIKDSLGTTVRELTAQSWIAVADTTLPKAFDYSLKAKLPLDLVNKVKATGGR